MRASLIRIELMLFHLYSFIYLSSKDFIFLHLFLLSVVRVRRHTQSLLIDAFFGHGPILGNLAGPIIQFFNDIFDILL